MDDRLPQGSELDQATHKFAFIVDGDVFGVISLDNNNPYDGYGVEKRCIAGLSSDPKVVPIPVDSPVLFGWTWDGNTFNPPVEQVAMSEEKLSAWQQYKKNLGNTRPWDLLKTDMARTTDAAAEARLNICKACPELIKATHQCKKCGCIMNLKVKLAGAECPIGKWAVAEGDDVEPVVKQVLWKKYTQVWLPIETMTS